MLEIVRLSTAEEIKSARSQFEQNVTTEVYNKDFSSIGEAFKVSSMIGRKRHIYIKCLRGAEVVGLALAWPTDELGAVIEIQNIISAPGSHAGSKIVEWFTDKTNAGLQNVRQLQLSAATAELRDTYAKPHYAFQVLNPASNKMTRYIG